MIEMMKTKRMGKTFDTCLRKKLSKISHIFIYLLHKEFNSIGNNKEREREYPMRIDTNSEQFKVSMLSNWIFLLDCLTSVEAHN